MVKVNNISAGLDQSAFSMSGKIQYFCKEEVHEHQSRGDLWLIIDGKVYDVTGFLEDHPGGEDILLDQAGLDATVAFEDVGHSAGARKQLEALYIGDLVEMGIKVQADQKVFTATVNFITNFIRHALPIWFIIAFAVGALAVAGFAYHRSQQHFA